ncbi:hypothetical protein GCM10007893_12330 [Paracoccus marinus]|nr:hypothetical protein GCM10007893_12330 [Paracoccus marinus]
MIKYWIAAGVVSIVLLMSALRDSEAVMNDTALSDEIARFTDAGPSGATLRLEQVTDFPWDTVRAFSGTAPLEYYRRYLGADFDLDDSVSSLITSDSGILVFQHKGAVVRTVVLGPPVYLGDGLGLAHERQDAVLMVITKDPGPYVSIEFVE